MKYRNALTKALAEVKIPDTLEGVGFDSTSKHDSEYYSFWNCDRPLSEAEKIAAFDYFQDVKKRAEEIAGLHPDMVQDVIAVTDTGTDVTLEYCHLNDGE